MKSKVKNNKVKTNKNSKIKENKSGFTTISKGVQLMPSGNYRVRKTVNGINIAKVFTNVNKAKQFYKGL